MTKRPVGLIKTRTFFVSIFKFSRSGSITNFLISGANFFSRSISAACCEEITTVLSATALSPWYSIVTCVFPSGRK
ncbi:unannotated protein [freshwater metagenome]|uniref:Unannotated protein n=1 Tax=freshwater metagenome TaxID=449393 RepID=A0A6J5ZFV9_9ZZZZ